MKSVFRGFCVIRNLFSSHVCPILLEWYICCDFYLIITIGLSSVSIHPQSQSAKIIQDSRHGISGLFRLTFSALCLEKPISRRVSRGLSEAL